MISTLMTYWYDEDHRYVVTLDDILEYLTNNKVKIRNVKLWELKKFRKFNLDPQLIKESRKNLQPILVVKDLAGNYTDVIDGKHRLADAFQKGEKTMTNMPSGEQKKNDTYYKITMAQEAKFRKNNHSKLFI